MCASDRYRTPLCQFIPADPVDQQVVSLFFEALAPIELNAYEASLSEQSKETQALLKHNSRK